MASKNLMKVRRMQMLGHDRLITLLDKQGGDIHDQDEIIYEQRESTPSYTTVNRVPQSTLNQKRYQITYSEDIKK